jgi:hypothetical protein
VSVYLQGHCYLQGAELRVPSRAPGAEGRQDSSWSGRAPKSPFVVLYVSLLSFASMYHCGDDSIASS